MGNEPSVFEPLMVYCIFFSVLPMMIIKDVGGRTWFVGVLQVLKQVCKGGIRCFSAFASTDLSISVIMVINLLL